MNIGKYKVINECKYKYRRMNECKWTQMNVKNLNTNKYKLYEIGRTTIVAKVKGKSCAE